MLAVFLGMGVALLSVAGAVRAVLNGGGGGTLVLGLFLAGVTFVASIVLVFGLVRRSAGLASLAGPECFSSLAVLCVLGIGSVVRLVAAGPASPVTPPGRGPAGVGGRPNRIAAEPRVPSGDLAAAVAASSRFPDKSGKIPIDPCLLSMPDRFLVPPLSGAFVPARGNSRLAVACEMSAPQPRIQVYDFFTETIQSTTRIHPFAVMSDEVAEPTASVVRSEEVAGDAQQESSGSRRGSVPLAPPEAPASGAVLMPWSVLGVSPAGRFVVVGRLNDRHGPAEVWRLGESPALVARIPRAPKDLFERFVHFPNEQTVIVSVDAKELQWWSLATGQPTRRGPNGLVQVTPGGGYLAIAEGNRIGFFDAAQGDLIATLEVGRGRLQAVRSFSISPDGALLLVYGTGKTGEPLAGLWHLESASSPGFVTLPETQTRPLSVQWTEERLALLGPYLFDAERGRIAWQYDREPRIGQSAGGRRWTTVNLVGGQVFATVPKLSDEARARLPGLAASVSRTLPFGQPVQGVVVFQQTPPKGDSAARLTRAFHEKLTAAGHPLRDDSSVIATMTVSDVPKPGKVKFYPLKRERDLFGDRRGAIDRAFDVPQRELRCDFTFRQGGSTVSWKQSVKADLDDLTEVNNLSLLKDDAQEVLDARWGVLSRRLENLDFPDSLDDYSGLPTANWDELRAPADVQARITQRLEDMNTIFRESLRKRETLPTVPPPRLWNVALEKSAPASQPVLLDAPLPLPPGQVEVLRFSSFAAGHVVLTIKPAVKATAPRNMAEAGRMTREDAASRRKAEGDGEGGDSITTAADGVGEGEGDDAAVGAASADDSQKRFLVRYDLRGRRRLARVPLADDDHLVDLSPDGQQYALGDLAKQTLQVWRCDDETDALDFQLEKIPLDANTRVYLAGRDLLMLVGAAELTAYRLPAGTVVWRKPLPRGAVAFNEDRAVFVTWQDGTLRVSRSADGEELGRGAALPLQEAFRSDYQLAWAAFNPLTLQLAAAVRGERSTSGHVGVWNLNDGTLAHDFPLLKIGQSAFWTSDRELLVEDRLVDVTLQTTVWKYPTFLPISPDGRAWFTRFDRKNVEHLAALAAPSRDVRKALDLAQKELPPGLDSSQTFGVELDISGGTMLRDELQARLQERLLELLRASDMTLAATPTRILQFQVQEHVDAQSGYRFEVGAQERLADKRSLFVNWRIKEPGKDGQLFSSGAFSVTLATIDYRIDERVEDANVTLTRAMHDALLRRLSAHSPFRHYASHHSGFGTSTVGEEGERVLPHPLRRPR